SENLAGPIAADQIRPHIVRDRAVRAWLGEDGSRATLAAGLNSCSQPLAELFVLLLETGQSLHTAFFNDKISLRHDATPNDTRVGDAVTHRFEFQHLRKRAFLI